MVRYGIHKQGKNYLKSSASYASVNSGSLHCQRFQAPFPFPLDFCIRLAKETAGLGWTSDSMDAESWIAFQIWTRRYQRVNPSFFGNLLWNKLAILRARS